MEEAEDLLSYLPLSFKTETEEEYIEFLWDAYQTNYKDRKFQFAFLAYHMLAMSFVYFNIWQIKKAQPENFSMSLIGFAKDEQGLIAATSPFAFSVVPERSILRFLRLIECDNSKIGKYAKLVDDRNETAHSNGHIFYSSEYALRNKINEILRVVDEIQNHSRPTIEKCYREFLEKSLDPEEREYSDHADQIREVLIHGNYMSQRDIDFCVALNPGTFSIDLQSQNARELHAALVSEYGRDSRLV